MAREADDGTIKLMVHDPEEGSIKQLLCCGNAKEELSRKSLK